MSVGTNEPLGSGKPQSRPKRSLGSCSLRLLLIATTLCCFGLAIWRITIRPYQLQRQAAQQIGDLGGTVRLVSSKAWLAQTWLAQNSLPQKFREEYFKDVVEVDLSAHHDGTAYAHLLALLPRLETLRLGTNFTDAHMQKLAHCKEIRRLFIQGTQVTDKGFEVCANFSQLRLAELGRNITDNGLAVLKNKKNLAYLDLSHTQVTDAGLEHLRGLPSLHKVRLNFRPITDTGLAAIQSLPKLDELYLIGCKEISEDGFRSLAEQTQLKQLDVKQTRISEATVGFLSESLSGCRVLREWRPPFY